MILSYHNIISSNSDLQKLYYLICDPSSEFAKILYEGARYRLVLTKHKLLFD